MSYWNKLQEATSPQSGADELPAPTPTKPSNEEQRPMAMLKRDDLTSAPVNTGDLNALLGRGSEFEGKLTFEGTVRIDGKFNGTIVTNDVLVIGEGAKVNAEAVFDTLTVSNVAAERVHSAAEAKKITLQDSHVVSAPPTRGPRARPA